MPEDDFDSWLSQKGEEVAEMKAALEEGGGGSEALAKLGERLARTKGCIACHSADGTRLVGPSFKGVYGMSEIVITDGAEREIVVDDEYLRRSIVESKADVVKGYQPLMPPQDGIVDDDEVKALIAYIKSLK
jgi:cytochrome c oxidase subunit 2